MSSSQAFVPLPTVEIFSTRMPKRKHRSHSSSRSSKKHRRERSRGRPRERSREVRSHESSHDRDPLPDAPSHPLSRDDLAGAIGEILSLLRHQNASGTTGLSSSTDITAVRADAPAPLESEVALPAEVGPIDEQTVLENRGGEPGMFLSSMQGERHNRLLICGPFSSFCPAVPAHAASVPDLRVGFLEPDLEEGEYAGEEPSLAQELFGGEGSSTTSATWDPTILASTTSEIRSGLKDELRQSLLAKYGPKGDLTCLCPPQLNKELISALAKRPSVIRRDDF